MAAGVFLYQRDRTARYPFDFARDEIVPAIISTPAERLTLSGPEEIEMANDRSRTFQVNSGVFSSSGHPTYTVRGLDLTELWWSITGAYPEAVC